MNAPVRLFSDDERKRKLDLLKAVRHRRLRKEFAGPGGLLRFVRHFWPILEPQTLFVDGWPLEAICLHLEAVTDGLIHRLLINVPPGFMKSLLTDVFWPAWEWGARDMAHMRYVTFSYSSSLTERDNRRFGDLVSSAEFQWLYGDRVKVVKKGDTMVSNKATGWKLASSVGGVGTGERGNRVILDDPHNVKESESEIVRAETVRWFRESMSNRLNSISEDAIVVIMQRVHEEDVSGVILANRFNYTHLMIKMEYEFDYAVDDDGMPLLTPIGWFDPRYDAGDPDEVEGMLAWSERFSPDDCAKLRHEVGPYAWAGQYQQAPAPRGGGIFQLDWWQRWESDDGKFPVFDYVIASLDSAFTDKEQNDPSGFTVWGTFVDDNGDRKLMLVHAWRKHLQFSGPRDDRKPSESKNQWVMRTQKTWGLIEWVKYTCERFNVDKLLIEAKASGISAAQELRSRYRDLNFAVQLQPVSGDKVARALAAQPTFSQLLVYAPHRDWAEMVIDEMLVFPKGKYKDLTDSTTQAIKYLRDTGMAQTDIERHTEEREAVTHRPKRRAALYPV